MSARIIQVRPSRNPRWQKQGGWEVFEAEGVSPFTAPNAHANQRSATHSQVTRAGSPSNKRSGARACFARSDRHKNPIAALRRESSRFAKPVSVQSCNDSRSGFSQTNRTNFRNSFSAASRPSAEIKRAAQIISGNLSFIQDTSPFPNPNWTKGGWRTLPFFWCPEIGVRVDVALFLRPVTHRDSFYLYSLPRALWLGTGGNLGDIADQRNKKARRRYVYFRVYPAHLCYRVRLVGYPAWIRTKNNALCSPVEYRGRVSFVCFGLAGICELS